MTRIHFLLQISISMVIISSKPLLAQDHSFRVFQENGIRIAESKGGPQYPFPLFTLEEILVLQQDPENEDSMLHRPGMFIRGEDGRYYVADGGASRIAVYDDSGAFLFEFGQRGFGPGDFAGLSWLTFVNNELHAYEVMTERVSQFSLEGHFIDIVSSPFKVEPLEGYIYRMHLTSDFLPIVIAQQDDYRPDAQRTRRIGYLYSAQGDTILSIHTAWVRSSKMIPIGDEQFAKLYLPYSPSPQVCFNPQHGFVYGTGVAPELNSTSLEGQQSLIRFDEEPELITARMRRRTRDFYDQQIAKVGGAQRAILKAQKGALEWPITRPFWRRIDVDDLGYIWMEVYETATERQERGGQPLYRVFSPEGEYLGQVRVPFYIAAWSFNKGHLLIIRTDNETGEYLLTVYRLHPTNSELIYPN